MIGRAKVILMERRRIEADDAFDLLRKTSQDLNTRLIRVAERVAPTGRLGAQGLREG